MKKENVFKYSSLILLSVCCFLSFILIAQTFILDYCLGCNMYSPFARAASGLAPLISLLLTIVNIFVFRRKKYSISILLSLVLIGTLVGINYYLGLPSALNQDRGVIYAPQFPTN